MLRIFIAHNMVDEIDSCCFRGCSGCNVYYSMFPQELPKYEELDNKDPE